MPRFNIEYAQGLVHHEEMHNLIYIMSIAMTASNVLVMSPLLISAGLFLCIEFKKMLDANPSTPLLSNGMISGYIIKGASTEIQDMGRIMKYDSEIYVGLYLTFAVFFGGSTMISMFSFWQMTRMRYMVSPQSQLAFQRLDQNL